MNKSGIVVSSDKKIACLMSSDGQFVKVKTKGKVPIVGEIYCGEIYKSRPIYKNSMIAAALAFFVFLGGGMYTYYTPAAEITVDINPAVKLVLNRWKRIISVSALNKDGEKLLTSVKLGNKSLDDGLTLIVQQAKKDNYINENYKTNKDAISIHIDENKKLDIQLPKFEESAKKDDLKYTITEEIRSNKENANKLGNKNVNNNTDKIEEDKQNSNKDKVNTESSNKKQNSVDNDKEKEIIKDNKSDTDKKPASTDDKNEKKEKNKYKNTNTRNKDSKEKDKDNSDKDEQNNKE